MVIHYFAYVRSLKRGMQNSKIPAFFYERGDFLYEGAVSL